MIHVPLSWTGPTKEPKEKGTKKLMNHLILRSDEPTARQNIKVRTPSEVQHDRPDWRTSPSFIIHKWIIKGKCIERRSDEQTNSRHKGNDAKWKDWCVDDCTLLFFLYRGRWNISPLPATIPLFTVHCTASLVHEWNDTKSHKSLRATLERPYESSQTSVHGGSNSRF